MTSREQFEKAFLAKFGFGRLTATANDDAAQMLNAAEWAWQASREALVIELPTADGLNHEHMLVQGFLEGVVHARAAIEAAGVKVKS